MGDRELDILYISGAPRSGSTILGMILGQLEGCCDVGELWALWRPAFKNHDLCGCGVAVDRCPFWSAVLLEALGPEFAERGPRLGELHRQTMGTMRAPLVWAHARGWRRRPEYAEYAEGLAAHYRAIAQVSGARTIVDSSKMASDALIAGAIPGVRLSVLHLVRDPRGMAWSWQKQVRQPGPQGRQLERHGVLGSAARWDAYNAFALLLLAPRLGERFRTVRYEDLVRDPAGVAAELARWIGADPATVPVTADPPVLALTRPTHSVWGNPTRINTGQVPLRLDDEWNQRMSPAAQRAVALATLPFLARYGYGVRPHRAQPPQMLTIESSLPKGLDQ